MAQQPHEREIVTLQLGNYANFVGAHFWNAQEHYFKAGEEVCIASVANAVDAAVESIDVACSHNCCSCSCCVCMFENDDDVRGCRCLLTRIV